MPPDPKPPRRIKDPDLMRQMHLEGGTCVVCGVSYGLELHHRVRRSQGGDDTRENLVWLCGIRGNNCHGKLHAGNLQLPQ